MVSLITVPSVPAAWDFSKTPREVISRLNSAIVKVLRSPEVIKNFISQGVDPLSCSPEEFSAKNRVDIDKWAKVIDNVGIQKID